VLFILFSFATLLNVGSKFKKTQGVTKKILNKIVRLLCN